MTYEAMEHAYPEVCAGYFTLHWGTDSHSIATVQEAPIMQLLRTLKINLEDTDHCTGMAQQIFKLLRAAVARAKESTQWSLLQVACLAIAFFGSRAFLTTLMQECQIQAPKDRCQFMRLVRRVVYQHQSKAWRLFTTSFNPNRINCFAVRRKRFDACAAHRLWRHFAKKGTLKINMRGDRRAAFSAVGRAFGAFTGKNYWQLLRLAWPSHSIFNPTPEVYTETGPGARAACNALHGLPRCFCIYTAGQTAADAYNVMLRKLLEAWRNVCRDALRSDEYLYPDELLHHVHYFLNMDEVHFQFILCELSKIIAFLDNSSVTYTRGYSWIKESAPDHK
jgi:hypothetical protein